MPRLISGLKSALPSGPAFIYFIPMPLFGKILVCALGAIFLGSLGGIATASSVDGWYETLQPPPGRPPNWVFGPVWTLLYAAMGTAVALVWHRVPSGPAKRHALILFAIQFALNMAWSPIFFALQRIDLALAVIVTLWVAIALTIRRFLPPDRTAAFLLVPYILWVSYATYLNAGFLILNR